jgi:hypothetical protein
MAPVPPHPCYLQGGGLWLRPSPRSSVQRYRWAVSGHPKKGKKKKHGKSHASADDPSVIAAYADMLAALGPSLGSLADELSQRNERRSQHLFHLVTMLRPFFEGLSQLREAMLWLARAPDVDGEIANLLREAADEVLSGAESMLADPDPRVLDEARHLMEIEFLFLDFSRTPERLGVWRDLPEHERSEQFGFDALRQREEKAQGIPPQRSLFEREEYRLHSSTVHPHPLSSDAQVSPPDDASGLFYDAADLIHHAARVLTAGLAAAGQTGAGNPQRLEAQLPPLDAVQVATQMIDENHRRIGLLE